MDYHRIKNLKESDPTIRLFNADNSPLIISFIFQAFKQNNKITISNDELVSNLTDTIYLIRNTCGEELYPDSAQNYLDNWANEAYLRKYYPADNDEPCFELTPSTEKALEWIKELENREFVGTESRLIKIIEMLKEIAYRNSDNPTIRLEELERKKSEIEEEINKINSGILEKFSDTQIKERYFDIYDTSNKLLSDFKQIEYNFRQLDQDVRKKQITSEVQKGELLNDIFSSHDILSESDQGKSFRAFWDLLLSQNKQDELDELIELIVHLPEIQDIKRDDTLDGLKDHLIEAGYRINNTNHILVEQLRKYLDDRIYLDNKRIIEIIRDIKSIAVEIKNNPPSNKEIITIPDRPQIEMIMERPLWDVSISQDLRQIDLEEGNSTLVDTQQLYSQFDINQEELRSRIDELLSITSQFTLKTLIEKYPVERGLAEILIYVDIALKNEKAFVNENISETMIVWNKISNRYFEIQLPQIIISR
ncbi:DUF3375 domain-containing protein [Methanogenium cariaci]|uniref:DUF3375 domain-containing protein n=1 Tax=Methanogenium cariaci TaxID=2197 RepID=UPI0007822BB5|nr:DUF3375 domain-containing protein [Methanogenium cariaci]